MRLRSREQAGKLRNSREHSSSPQREDRLEVNSQSSEVSDPASGVSDPGDAEDAVPAGRLGFYPALFEVHKHSVFDDEPEQYSITMCGVQLRRLGRLRLCALLAGGSFYSFYTHSRVEERVSQKGFDMWLLTAFQFASIALLSTASQALGRWSQPAGSTGWPKASVLQRLRSFGASSQTRLCLLQALVVFLSQAMANKSNQFLRDQYPTKMLVKASKLMLALCVRRFVFRLRSSYTEWLAGLFLAAGVGTLAYSRYRDASGSQDYERIGLLCVFISLFGDAFLGPLQEYTFKAVPGLSLAGMMRLTYGFSAVLVGSVYLAEQLLTGAGESGLSFAAKDSAMGAGSSVGLELMWEVGPSVVLYGALSYIGNCFVQSMIQHFGLLLTLSTLTARQFVTIISSYYGYWGGDNVIEQKPFGELQQLSVALVFTGSLLNLLKHAGKKPKSA